MLNIYINTWGNYNENGADGGQWIALPMGDEELQKTLYTIAEAVGDADPEFFINDYEWVAEVSPRAIDENESIEDLNEYINTLDAIGEWEQKEIAAAMEAFGYDFEEAFDKQQKGYFTFYAGMDLEEVAEEIINECYDLPEFALIYFDFKAFARDLGFDGYEETEYGVIVE